MAINITYDGNRLVLPEFSCDCGFNHSTPDMDIYIGSGILQQCADYIDKRNLGRNGLVVADNNTWKIAGHNVDKILREKGYNTTLCILEREGVLEPDETALGEIMLAIEKDTDFIVAVGSGVINDLSRYAASCICKPLVSIGTAASMDGYTSVISSLLIKGLKVSKSDEYAKIIICDVDIMKKAPYDMMVSGFGDVLGKYIAKADWLLGKIINNETICPVCVDIITQAVEKCIDNIDGIRNTTDEGIQSLIEALILTGLTILIVGQTRPVASNEHNMCHFWDMMKLQKKEKSPSHGTSVGVATVYAAKMFDLFLNLDVSKLNKALIRSKKQTKTDWEKGITESYGLLAPKILKDNPNEYIEWNEQERRINAVILRMNTIRKELEFLPTSDEIVSILERIGSPIIASQLGVDNKMLKDSLMYAKDYRMRYTVFKTVNELGLLEEFTDNIMAE